MRRVDLSQLKHFEEPFRWINTPDYPFQTLIREFPDSVNDPQKLESFPNHISELYYAEPGIAGRRSWILFGKLDTGIYFFFTAMCLDDGFGNFGSMTIRATDDWGAMLAFGLEPEAHMHIDDYQRYLKN